MLFHFIHCIVISKLPASAMMVQAYTHLQAVFFGNTMQGLKVLGS